MKQFTEDQMTEFAEYFRNNFEFYCRNASGAMYVKKGTSRCAGMLYILNEWATKYYPSAENRVPLFAFHCPIPGGGSGLDSPSTIEDVKKMGWYINQTCMYTDQSFKEWLLTAQKGDVFHGTVTTFYCVA